MYVIIGSIVVLVGVFGGFVLEKGNLSTLIQPIEMMILFGAAIGALIISAGSGIKIIIRDLLKVFSHKSLTKAEYMEVLLFFYDIASKARKEGLLSLESHFDSPEESDIIKKYHFLMHDKNILSFICDNIKLAISIRIEAQELDNLMEMDIAARQEEAMFAPHMLTNTADSLPGLGIVAAVLGVVITMQFISSPPEVLGHHVAVALVGTFLGILSCYGFLGPIANNMAHHAKEQEGLYNLIKACIIPFVIGLNPVVVVEYGRRVVPIGERPASNEIEDAMKKSEGRG